MVYFLFIMSRTKIIATYVLALALTAGFFYASHYLSLKRARNRLLERFKIMKVETSVLHQDINGDNMTYSQNQSI